MGETDAPRLACLEVPLFPLAARLRSEPGLHDRPLAIVAESGGAVRVVAASRRARAAGVRAKQTIEAARASLPGLIVRPRDAECENAAREALLDLAESFSPRVEDGGEGLVLVDAAGRARPSEPAAELRLGHAWTAAADKQAGLPVRIGFAASRLAARLAAAEPDSPTVIAAGDEAGFLAPIPLRRALARPDALRVLRRWGLSTLGELATLPASQLDRLGAAGEELRSIALGEEPQPLAPRRPPPVFREGMTLAEPLVDLEPFSFLARGALERIAERLKCQGAGCVCLELSLELEPEGRYRRSIALPAATCDVKTLLTLLRLEIESHPPRAAIAAFAIGAHPDRPRGGQISLFGPPAALPEKLAAALQRIFTTVGEDRVGSPRTADGCRPERFQLAPFCPPRATERGGKEPRPGLMTVRVLRPPVALEVLTDDVLAGSASVPPPDFVKSRPAKQEERPRIQGRVQVASGPWTLADGWWTKAPTARDYWDVELSCSGVYRIFRDRGSGEWFADGVYD